MSTVILPEEVELLLLAADAFDSLEQRDISTLLHDDQTKETLLQRLTVVEHQCRPFAVWTLVVAVKAALQGKIDRDRVKRRCLKELGLI